MADFGIFYLPIVMATSIIKNLTIFRIFGFFSGPRVIDFLEIEKTFGNKRVANYELMAKFKFLLISNGYSSEKWQKICE